MDRSDDNKKKKYDPNVVGLEESSDDSSIETDDSEGRDTCEVVETTDKIINVEKGATSSAHISNETNTKAIEIKESEPVQVEAEVKKPILEHPTINVQVKRDPKVQVARLKLPILGEEQRVMELINENEFVIVAGETGMKCLIFL